MKSFALGIVLYKPTGEQIDRVKHYSTTGVWDRIFVANNTPDSEVLFKESNIVVFNNKKNLGLSKPYNQFIKLSTNNDFLCLMDQDSKYSDEEIKKMVGFINEKYDSLSNVCIVAPRSYASISKIVPRANKTTNASFVINSGSFLNLGLVREKGLLYDENIFLDYLDYDYCYSARKAGLEIIIYEDSVLYQSLGYEEEGKHANHSPIRFYYMCSARKYSLVKHKGFLIGSIVSFIKMCSTVFYIIRTEDNKRLKIKQCFKGQFKHKGYLKTEL